jgi:hypothetical protein
MQAGTHVVSLDAVSVPDGTYVTRVVANNRFGGGTFKPNVAAVGMVSGFIPGPSPKLIVGGREVDVGAIRQVTVAQPSA